MSLYLSYVIKTKQEGSFKITVAAHVVSLGVSFAIALRGIFVEGEFARGLFKFCGPAANTITTSLSGAFLTGSFLVQLIVYVGVIGRQRYKDRHSVILKRMSFCNLVIYGFSYFISGLFHMPIIDEYLT